MNQRYKKVGEYIVDFGKRLGSGCHGQVYPCKKDMQKYAIKIVSRVNIPPNSRKQLYAQRQKQIMMNLGGQNVVYLYEYLQSTKTHYFVMELCEGNLLDLLNSTAISQQKAIDYLAQIVNGYKNLYQNKIIHRDIKPQNILYNGSTLKIADFGISTRFIQQQGQAHSLEVGTPGYMAPQVFLKPYDYKVDIWSIGVTFYLMLHGDIPWDKINLHQMLNTKLKFKKSLSNVCKDFLSKCIEPNQNKRMSYQDMINHPIFANSTLTVKQESYAQALLKEIVTIITDFESQYKKAQQSLNYYSMITKSLNASQFGQFLKNICQFVDKPKSETIFNFYKNQENLIPISMLQKMLKNKSIEGIKQRKVSAVRKVNLISEVNTC